MPKWKRDIVTLALVVLVVIGAAGLLRMDQAHAAAWAALILAVSQVLREIP